MSNKLSLTSIMNNTRKQLSNSLKTTNNVIRAVVRGNITEANARNIGRSMGLTNAAVNGMLGLSQNKSANERGAQILMNMSKHGRSHRTLTRRKAKRGTRRR
jgi:hypothetical protein